MPTVCLGLDDACTKPSEFTIDKRCYVTNEQKKTYPYNTVVALLKKVKKGNVYTKTINCTGTIIRESDGIKRVYTAKHCTDLNGDKVVDKTITIKTHDGDEYNATNEDIQPTDAYGNYNLAEKTLSSGDWAKYTLFDVPDDLPFTTFTTRHSGTLGKLEATAENSSVPEILFMPLFLGKAFLGDNKYNAQVVGYGSLKIMNDAEIQDFKDKYTEFLKTSLAAAAKEVHKNDGLSEDKMQEKIEYYKEDDYNRGVMNDGSVHTRNPIVEEFIYGALKNALSGDDYVEFFEDGEQLKTSLCQLNVDGYKQGCQSWGGNSGGPIFDKDGRLMGIHTRGNGIIGGEHHAGRDYNNPRNNDGNRVEKPDGRPDDNIHFLK